MYEDKSVKWLKRAVNQHRAVIERFRYRYFWTDEKDLDKFRRDVLDKLVHQLKLMQEELDAKRGLV